MADAIRAHAAAQPSNLLLNSECAVKLADFGLARSVAQLEQDEGPSPVLTDYVATRWYRAPEILLGSPKYTYGVDMWSTGARTAPCACDPPACCIWHILLPAIPGCMRFTPCMLGNQELWLVSA